MFDTPAVPTEALRLVAAPPESLPPDARLGTLRAADRLVAWAEARRARLVAAVAGRAPSRDSDDWGVEEVAAALRLTPRAAQLLVATSRTVTAELPSALDAWERGSLTGRHVQALCETVAGLAPAARRAVEEQVLAHADEQTVPQFRKACQRAALRADSTAAEMRHERAVRARSVEVVPMSDGIAGLWATGPADDVMRVFGSLDALASVPEGVEGIAAARFDALVSMVAGHGPLAGGIAAGPGRRPVLRVITRLDTLRKASDDPGGVEGLGALPASVVRRMAADADWQRVVVDTDGTPLDVDVPVRLPPDVTDALRRASTAAPEPPVVTSFVAAWLSRPLRGHESDPDVHDPSAALRDLVLARDRTCRYPGCTRRAERSHIDHAVPFPDGPTDLANCHVLCRRHHRLKHESGWTIERHPDSSVTWTSPLGQTYRVGLERYPVG